jgi:dTMP kinase
VGRHSVNRRRVTPGKFITLEGGEAVGKSTNAQLLADALRAQGKDVVVTREPGGTPGAEAIRNLLMTGDEERWSARSEALLFAAARADHVEKVIRPALERGSWVVCDRYVDSTRAYQGGAGGMSDSDILALHHIGSRGLMPDRTFLLQLSEKEAADRSRRRVMNEDDRIGMRDANYHRDLNAAFSMLAGKEPKRFCTIDSSGALRYITQAMVEALSDLL